MKASAVLDVGAQLAGLLEIAHDVGLRDAQVDASEVQHIHHVLVAALADDRQHAQLVAVVEHGRHVVGEIEIGAVGIARDHRDGVLVELVAQRRVAAAAALAGRAAAWRPATWPGCCAAAGSGNSSSAAASTAAKRGSVARSPSPRNRTSTRRCSSGVRMALVVGSSLVRTMASYHRNYASAIAEFR